MTRAEALALKSFDQYCTCGGYAVTRDNPVRDHEHPHTSWCPQREQYEEWWKALHSGGENAEVTKDSRRAT